MGMEERWAIQCLSTSGSAINTLQTVLPPPIFDAFTYPIQTYADWWRLSKPESGFTFSCLVNHEFIETEPINAYSTLKGIKNGSVTHCRWMLPLSSCYITSLFFFATSCCSWCSQSHSMKRGDHGFALLRRLQTPIQMVQRCKRIVKVLQEAKMPQMANSEPLIYHQLIYIM